MANKALIAALLVAGLGLGQQATAQMATPSMLANTCAGCHGPDGVSTGPATPSISGFSRVYFINAMLSYKYGEDMAKIEEAVKIMDVDPDDIDTLKRPATIMGRIAKGYSDEEIKVLADFFARNTFLRATQNADAALAKRGKAVHDEACEKCHEEGGRIGDGSGLLAGQWMPYLRNAVQDFTSGHRTMPKKMRAKVKDLTDEDFEALVHFYGSQN